MNHNRQKQPGHKLLFLHEMASMQSFMTHVYMMIGSDFVVHFICVWFFFYSWPRIYLWICMSATCRRYLLYGVSVSLQLQLRTSCFSFLKTKLAISSLSSGLHNIHGSVLSNKHGPHLEVPVQFSVIGGYRISWTEIEILKEVNKLKICILCMN